MKRIKELLSNNVSSKQCKDLRYTNAKTSIEKK